MRKKTDHAAHTVPESGTDLQPQRPGIAQSMICDRAALRARAEEARRGHRWQEAVDLYSEALATPGGTDGGRTELNLRDARAECSRAEGDCAAELADLRAIVTLADRLGEPDRAVAALWRIEKAALVFGRMDEGLAAAEEGLARSRRLGDRHGEALSLNALCDAYSYQARTAEAVACGQAAVALARELNDATLLAWCLAGLAGAQRFSSEAGEANRIALEALEQAKRSGDREAETAALNNVAITTPDWGASLRYQRLALDVATAIGHERSAAKMQGNLGFAYDSLGLYRGARGYCERAAAYARARSLSGQLNVPLVNLAHAAMGLGDLPGATRALEEALAASQETGDKSNEVLTVMLQGRLALHAGQALSAGDLLRQSEAAMREVAFPDRANMLALIGQAELLRGDVAAAQISTEQAAAMRLRAPGSVLELPAQEIWWARYQALLAASRNDEAWDALDRARAEMLSLVATIGDDGLRRNYLNKVTVNRLVVPAWLAEARSRGESLDAYTAALGGRGSIEGQLERMLEIGVRLNSRSGAEDLPGLIMDELAELSGAEQAALYLFDGSGARQVAAELVPVLLPAYMCLHTPASAYEETLLPPEQREALLAEATEKRAPLLRHLPKGVPEIEQYSVLCVPMTTGTKLVGLVYAELRGIYGRFSLADLNLVSVLANQAAVAVENANWSATLELKVAERTAELQTAHQDLELRNNELAIINSVGEAMASQLDVDTIVRIVGDKVRNIFQTEVVNIVLYDAPNALLQVVYEYDRDYVPLGPPFPLGQGLTSIIIRTRQPLLLGTLQEQRDSGALYFVEATDEEIVQSYLGVPIIVGDRLIGVVSVQSYRQYAYDENSVRLLSTLASNMGVAIENARLFQETRRLLAETEQRAAELTTVNRISQALTSELELSALLKLVGEQIRQTFAADIVYVALHDPEANLIRFPYAFGEEMPSIPFGRGLTSHILRAGEPLLINQDVSGRSAELGAPVVGLPPKSYLGVPITVGNRALGVISVQSTQHEDRFSERDVHLLSTIAANVGTAIRNAQLYQETQRRADQMAAIAEVGREVSATLSLDAVLGNIAAHVHRLFDAQDTVLRLAEPDGGTFRTTMALGLYAEQFKSDVIELGRGIHGSIAQTGIAEVIDNPDADPRGLHLEGTPEVEESPETLMIAPLIAQGRTIGMLSVYRDRREGLFTQVDLDFLVGLARQATVALENARLFEETRRREAELGLINSIQQDLASNLDLEGLIDLVGDRLRAIFNTQDLGIRLYDPATNLLYYPYEYDHGQRLTVAPRQPSSLSAYVLETRQPFVANQDAERRWVELGWTPLPGTMMSKSVAGVPIIVAGQATGLIVMDDYEKENAFTDSDLHLLQTLASSIGVAVKNARLFAEIQRQKQLSEALVQTSPVAIVTTDQRNRVTSWNPAAERLFGYRPEEAVGEDLNGLIIDTEMPELWAEAQKFTDQALAGGGLHAITQRCRRGGSLVNVEIFTAPIAAGDQDAQAQRFLTIYHDLTELKRAEEDLHREIAQATALYRVSKYGKLSESLPETLCGLFDGVLEAGTGVEAVFAVNDEMTVAAVETARGLGYEDFPAVGYNASDLGRAGLRADKLCATVGQDLHELGRRGVIAALQALEGLPTEAEILLPVQLITEADQPILTDPATMPAVSRRYSLGVALGDYETNAGYREIRDGVQRAAAEASVELKLVGHHETRALEQAAAVEAMLAAEVDALILVPLNEYTLSPVVQRALQRGIPVVALDQQMGGAEVTADVGADNRDGGRLAARFLACRLGGRGRVGVIYSDLYTARRARPGF